MDVLTKFLGKGPYPVSLNPSAGGDSPQLCYNDKFCVISTKDPIPYQDETHSHEHDSYEFTVPLNAAPRLRLEKRIFELPSNHIIVCNPEQSHGPAGIIQNHRLMAFYFNRVYLQDISKSIYPRRETYFRNRPAVFDHYLRSLLKTFIDEVSLQQAGYEFMIDSISIQTCIHLLRSIDNNSGQPNPEISPGKKHISTAIDFLRENYNRAFNLDDLAGAVNLSKYYFVRAFKKETGRTPHEYLVNLKIEKAQEFLRSGRYTVTEVCFLCGFQNHSHFTRCFRQIAGCTPSAYKALFTKVTDF